ncbi:MAG: bifunctional methylenetetrahydrofolate dehydrogenase/methenyltetrahydrofolate cyclohydrolase FolD [Rickettsiales bacterium]|nr:bifunctional methylenetetrahydrofolate dehydrogenase/methenyltetrahydrofolate cyclohydrolase FolD [Pseudomonadota bacterium]MDA0965374.1 bifunctional methylenetetrahydrofolate dehydrogenase/methenyltetrahydrofolate cyclohydrolase FolD [Pseudomonadota bacterium]MDG4544302.1 bifunctional methylenetetrahydrofolate dehydrogenase/methenyltetrahydrofolate cyclohydrolase FolD [Rickettsiales bacterium]MDG4544853.1 bifunctional methylenetetrahydrofolate dehydrogenase/methenyltetrahydrofolate cyclohydr
MSQAKIIDGKVFAQEIRSQVQKQVSQLKEQHNITPGLAVILVGEDPASQVYVRNKGKQTVEVGMNSFEFKLPSSVSQEELVKKIEELNKDPKVNGILVQLPLPSHIEENAVINSIDPAKDVDGFHVINAGRLATGQDATVPCTPLGCILMLKDTLGDLTGLHAVIIGRSNIVGKPMARLLLKENCTVTMTHSRTKDLEAECRKADIVVAAVGVEGIVRGEWIKPGATVIDVGINRVEASDGKYKLVGDVNFNEVSKVAAYITPVPGGVGPMTIACLLRNTLEVTLKQNNTTLD